MKPTALLLNLLYHLHPLFNSIAANILTGKYFYHLLSHQYQWLLLVGLISVDDYVYKKILGILLIIPIVRFLFFANVRVGEIKRSNFVLSLIIGAAIGFLSGLIGIGGGIILSPVLLLLKWTDMKQTAAISAIFIFVNSLSGLAGQLQKGINFSADMYAYVVIAFVGGLCGAYFGSLKLKQDFLKYLLAVVLIIASYKLLFTSA
jgi:uncharacterized membrane protein YfcA